MRKRMAGLVAIGAASALMLAGCAGGGNGGGNGASGDNVDFSAEPTGDLTAWGFENADDVGQARLDYAEEQLSDVKIELDATAFDTQKFTTRLASGDVPDVVQMDRRFVGQFASQGLIVPLDDCFSAQDVDPTELWYENVVDDVTLDGSVWAVPQFYQPPAILVNLNVLEPAGLTVEDIDTSDPDKLLSAVEKMYQESGGVPSVLGMDPVSTGVAELWVLGNGGQLTDDEGKPTLDDPGNAAGIDLLKQINDAQGGFAKVKSFTDSFDTFGENNQFVANQVGSQINQQWYPNVLSPYVDEINIQAVPFKNSDGEPFAVASGSSFVIPVGAKNAAAACAWMVALTSDEAWMAAGEARAATREEDGGINTGLFTGSPAADQEIRDQYVKPSGNANFDQVISTYYDVVGYGTSFGASPAGLTIQSELNNAVGAVLLGEKTTEEALADAQDAAMRAYESATAGG